MAVKYSRALYKISCISAGGVIEGVTFPVTFLFEKVTFLFKGTYTSDYVFLECQTSIINSNDNYGQ